MKKFVIGLSCIIFSAAASPDDVVIADVTTLDPNGNGTVTLSRFDEMSCSGGNATFLARAGIEWNVLVTNGGSLELVADSNTSVPDGPQGATFESFRNLDIDGDTVAFVGVQDFVDRGVYARINGALMRIADTTMVSPDGSLFREFRGACIDGGTIAFMANTAASSPIGGIFAYVNGSIVTIADRDTEIPGKLPGSTFDSFSTAYCGAGTIGFLGQEQPSLEQGIYLFSNGTLSVGVDRASPVPDETVPVTFNSYSAEIDIEGTNLAFEANLREESAPFDFYKQGIFVRRGTTISKIVTSESEPPGGDPAIMRPGFPDHCNGRA